MSHRTLACLLSAALLASCGSASPDAAPPTDSAAPDTPQTTIDSPVPTDVDDPVPTDADADADDAPSPPPGSGSGVDATVTASGSGGCVDSVSTDALSISDDDTNPWLEFDLVLGDNCGDPGRTVQFGELSAPPEIAISGPLCTGVVSCDTGQPIASLDGMSDPAVRFEIDLRAAADELLAASPITVTVPATYTYPADALPAEPFDIEIRVEARPAAPTPTGDTTPADTGPAEVEVIGGGFDLLQFPFVGFADSASEFGDLTSDLDIPIDAISVNWGTDAVIAFAIPTDLCPPVLIALDVSGGTATPIFENPGYNGCEQPLLAHTTFAAVDRSLLADVDQLTLPRSEPFFDSDVAVDVDATPPAENGEPDSAVDRTFGELRGTAPLPSVGEAATATLDDGAPVFVVHHHDGSISAVDPRAGTRPEAPDNVFGLARWNAASRKFFSRGVWDAYGRRIDGFRTTDLTGHATRVVPGDSGPIVEIGRPVAPPAGAPLTQSPDRPAMTDRRADVGDAITLSDALELAPGRSAVVDAIFIVDPSGATICEFDGDVRFPLPECADGSPVIADVDPQPSLRTVFDGPVLVTRTSEGFEQVAPLGGFSSESV